MRLDGVTSKEVLEMLNCPVCLDICAGAIKMCVNGHTICSSCEEKLRIPKKCPTCRAGAPFARNMSLEKMTDGIVVECKHDGCSKRIKRADLSKHYAACKFSASRLSCGSCKKLLDNQDCLEDHNKVCPMVAATCYVCDHDVLTRASLPTHLRFQHSCVHPMVDCRVCKEPVLRDKLRTHYEEKHPGTRPQDAELLGSSPEKSFETYQLDAVETQDGSRTTSTSTIVWSDPSDHASSGRLIFECPLPGKNLSCCRDGFRPSVCLLIDRIHGGRYKKWRWFPRVLYVNNPYTSNEEDGQGASGTTRYRTLPFFQACADRILRSFPSPLLL